MESDGMTEKMETDPTTGGQKGSKPEQPSLIPVEFLETLSRVYSKGLGKYERHNWRRGYRWSLSYDALQRHLMAFWKGEDLDEDGEPHLAHAAWHCATLIVFMKEQREKDDRWKGPMESKVSDAQRGGFFGWPSVSAFLEAKKRDGDRGPVEAPGTEGTGQPHAPEAPSNHLEGKEDLGSGQEQGASSCGGGRSEEVRSWKCTRCVSSFTSAKELAGHRYKENHWI